MKLAQHHGKVEGSHHGILLVLDCFDRNFRQEVIVQQVSWEMAFDGKTFRQEFLIKVLPGLLTHEDASAAFVVSRPTCSTHHLQDIHDGIVHISVLLAFIVLHAHDDHYVASNGN